MMIRKLSLLQIKEDLKEIFLAGVESVKPHKIIENKIKFEHNHLIIGDKSYALRDKIYMTGFGKGVMGMAIAMEKLLGNRLIKGIISVPRGTKNQLWDIESGKIFPKLTGVINYCENSINNQPDDDTLKTTRDIIDMVDALDDNDTLIVLISGGGSALLSMSRFNISPEEKLNLSIKLFNLGADITEINLIRQKLSVVKAGGLARMAYPASVIGLILSDIINDPVELIASGPTVYSSKAPEDVNKILKKYNVLDQIDGELKKILLSKELHDDKHLLNDKTLFSHVENIIVGNNSLAIEAARLECLRKNLIPIVLFNNVQGLVSNVSAMYGKLCCLICQALIKSITKDDFISSIKTDRYLSVLNINSNEIYEILQGINGQDLILIAGGEPTVLINGIGKGGRNQELALRFSLDWSEIVEKYSEVNKFNVVFLSAGTDGQDGPTDAAGAFGYSDINSIVRSLCTIANDKYKKQSPDNIDAIIIEKIESMIPENVLKNNDSYTFYSRFKNGEDLLKTGITGTNVMDLHLIYIKKNPCTCHHDITEEKINSDPFVEHNFFSDLLKNSQSIKKKT